MTADIVHDIVHHIDHFNHIFKHNFNNCYSYQAVMIQTTAVFTVTKCGLKLGKFFTTEITKQYWRKSLHPIFKNFNMIYHQQ